MRDYEITRCVRGGILGFAFGMSLPLRDTRLHWRSPEREVCWTANRIRLSHIGLIIPLIMGVRTSLAPSSYAPRHIYFRIWELLLPDTM